MFQKMLLSIFVLVGVTSMVAGDAKANWSETFNNNAYDLTTWDWGSYPDFTGYPGYTNTFTHTITDRPDTTNDYLTIRETTSVGNTPYPGSAFGMGMGNPADKPTDVRFGAVVNVMGDASHNIYALGARTTYFISPGDPYSPAPGLISSGYVLLINWANGPANLIIEVQKYVNLQNIMRIDYEVSVPGLAHARSYYAELDIVGSDPTYVTGCLYEYKGGPLVAKLPTLIDTSGNDPWEDTDPPANYPPFTSGVSGIGGMNENPAPPGYRVTFDDVSSISNGPAAVNPSPADGAKGVSINADLSWKEAAFATSRELWFGKPGLMQKVTPSPAGTSYDLSTLEFSQTYEWRVDEIGSATVQGHVWTFTTGPCLAVDDFESYANDAAIRVNWVDSIPVYEYVFLEASRIHSGAKAMRLEYQNQYEPYITEATRTFAAAQDWTTNNNDVNALSLFFRGIAANVEQVMYVKLEDAFGTSYKVVHPYKSAVESESWYEWTIDLKDFSDANVKLAAIKKITIGVGDGSNSGQSGVTVDMIYIDDITLCPCRCFNPEKLDLRGDLDGNCKVNLEDLAVMANGWLNDGMSVTP